MIKNSLYILAFGCFMLASCINDESTEGNKAISVISLQTPLNSSYTLNQGDTLKISPTSHR